MRRFVDLLVPRVCRRCEKPLADWEDFLCEECEGTLAFVTLEGDRDPIMMRRFPTDIDPVRAASLYIYAPETTISSVVQDFKYRHCNRLAEHCGEILGNSLPPAVFNDVDFLTPLPMHWFKQLKRGYNQAELLTRGVGRATGIPILKCVKAVRSHATQTSKTEEQRKSNLMGVFRRCGDEILNGRHIMIVDDICTTGSTLTFAARALRADTPNVRISFLTFARTL